MNIQTSIATLLLLAGTSTLTAASPVGIEETDRVLLNVAGDSSQSASSAWQPLFAADLSDAVFPEGVWTTSNGEITASEDKVLWSAKEYENFVLDLEFKNGPAANSGVLVYVSDIKKWVPNSVEVQITDDYSEPS